MNLSKLFLPAIVIAMVASCSQDGKNASKGDKSLENATREELQQAVAERDELLVMLNDIQETMDEINRLEGIVTISTGGETSDVADINNNLEALRATLEDRRKQIDQLEARLKQSTTTNNNLMATISTLRSQLEMQAQQIEMLTAQLEEANKQIGELNTQVADLNTQVEQVTEQRDVAAEEARRQADLNNQVYYAIGSKDELKKHDIVEGGGFLRKTKTMEGDFDLTFFNKADMRTLTVIPLHSKKAKVLTKQSKDTYEIIEVDGQKELHITDPAKFWSVYKYLVVQID